MRDRKISIREWIVSGFALLLFLRPGYAVAAPDFEKARLETETFYRWYIKAWSASDTALPFMGKKVERWVDLKLLTRLRDDMRRDWRNGDGGGADYFLQVQDDLPLGWASHFKVEPVIFLNRELILKVTIDSRSGYALCAHMRMIGKNWKITQVDEGHFSGRVPVCQDSE